jgi:hypothetical protein
LISLPVVVDGTLRIPDRSTTLRAMLQFDAASKADEQPCPAFAGAS